MKLLTLNFLTCAVKSCKPRPEAFPLHVREAELELVSTPYNALLLRNLLPRLDRRAVQEVAAELSLTVPSGFMEADDEKTNAMEVDGGAAKPFDPTPDAAGAAQEGETTDPEWLKEMHVLLLETQVISGKLVCGNCGHEYAVREGIPNFLLPPHLV